MISRYARMLKIDARILNDAVREARDALKSVMRPPRTAAESALAALDARPDDSTAGPA